MCKGGKTEVEDVKTDLCTMAVLVARVLHLPCFHLLVISPFLSPLQHVCIVTMHDTATPCCCEQLYFPSPHVHPATPSPPSLFLLLLLSLWCAQPSQQQHWHRRSSGDCRGAEEQQRTAELVVSAVLNGCVFAFLAASMSYLWFKDADIATVMAVAMFANLVVAGLSGTIVPLGLVRAGVDPAVASSVLITTITDVVGFFVFLGLAALYLM